MKILVVIVVFLVPQLAFGQNYADTLYTAIEEIFENSGLPGLSVGVVDANGILFSEGYGYSNRNRGTEYQPNTTQSIASVSKTFIALALMKTIEEGHFTMDTPINLLLPFKVNNPHLPKDTIRVKHLATHTSGILDADAYWREGYFLLEPPEFDQRNYTQGERDFFQMILPNQRIDANKFLKNYLAADGQWYNLDHFSKSAPGSNYEYSNIGAALAAYLIEIAQKMPYSEYLKQTIFEPLGMTSTNWDFEPALNPEMEAVPYLNHGDRCPRYLFSTYADGAIRSSAIDLQKYLMEMIRGVNGAGKLVSNSSYRFIFDQQYSIDESDGIGIFWFVQKRLNDRFHQGSGAGITTVVSFNPKDQLGVVILCNHETDLEQQSEAYVSIWKTVIKYRELLKPR